jgi:hypothetical protein
MFGGCIAMKIFRFFLVLLFACAFILPAAAQDKNVTVAAPDAKASKLTFSESSWLELHYLLQLQFTSANVFTSPEEDKDNGVWTKDFAIRRSRVILKGQVTDSISFFTETDVASDSDVTSQNLLFTQDAHISYKVADEFIVDAGKMLLPFTHLNRQSAVTLLGVDYSSTFIKLALDGNSKDNWRDYGVEFRGLVLDTPFGAKKGFIDYRIGIFDGISRTDKTWTYQNKGDYPRLTGRIACNLFDAENDFFFSENYLGKKKIVSLGFGFDWQPNVALSDEGTYTKDYFGWTIDLTVDFPVMEGYVLALQSGYLGVENNPGWTGYKEGYAYYIQAGLLVMNQFQPVIKYVSAVNEKEGALAETEKAYVVVGLNWIIKGHNANLKFEYQHPTGDNDETSGEKKLTLQGQVFI